MEGGRQRARVGGGQAIPVERATQPIGQPDHGMQSQVFRAQASGFKQAAAPSPTTFSAKAEPVACYRASTPVALSGAMPEPPAPRSWTPSKMSSANTPARMSPAEALEREMAELEYTDPNSMATATAAVSYTQHSANTSSPAGSGNLSYKKAYYSNAYEDAATQALAGRSGSPGPAQPFVAQHNNLMPAHAAGEGSRPGSGGSKDSYGGIAKLKERVIGHAPVNNLTTVQAFREPTVELQQGLVAASSSAAVSGSSSSASVQRAAGKVTRLLATGHASSTSRTTAEWRSDFAAALSMGNKLAALCLSGPSNGVVQCYVKRNSGLLGMGPSFELRLESSDELLAVARKRKKSASSSYLISMGSNSAGVTRADEQLIGKLKANVMGTEYLLRGKGGDPAVKKGFNAQLMAVNYKPTINHIKAGPRTMTAIVPVPESQAWNGSTPAGGQFDSLTSCMEAARARELPLTYERDLVMLHTMKPHYDPVKQVNYLDFKGRVTKSSLKNFQLVHWDHNTNQLGSDLVLMFGKKGHDEYAMDFCYPLSALQAFALALTSIDSKLCYTV